ncbi:MAG: prepilin-type N-terminal cleavage/methylation domain-containing protein [Elusimicrobiota bacterium]
MNKWGSKKNGFTLTELLVSIIIFSFMAMTLASVYATANRYFYQQYRQDLYKNKFTLSMKFIKNKLVQATDIDIPTSGSTSNDLLFYTNFVKDFGSPYIGSGCAPTTAISSNWHYFCVAGTKLYYHTGTLAGVVACPNTAPTNNNVAFIPACGSAGGVMLSDNIVLPSAGSYFQRGGNLPPNVVRISLKMSWQTKQSLGGSTAIRTITSEDESYVSVNRPGQW